MSYRYNPLSGNLDLDNDTGASLSGYTVDKITLGASDITNKYVVLSAAPAVKPDTRLVVISGIEQDYSIDFEVTADDAGKRLSWDGLGLDGILEDGDKLIVVYS